MERGTLDRKLRVAGRQFTILRWDTRIEYKDEFNMNPITAGVRENQDKSHVLCPNMTNDTSLESSCALLLESAKKFANLQKLNFLSQNPVL